MSRVGFPAFKDPSPKLLAQIRLHQPAGGMEAACPVVAVRPEHTDHEWRKIPPGGLSIHLVPDGCLGGGSRTGRCQRLKRRGGLFDHLGQAAVFQSDAPFRFQGHTRRFSEAGPPPILTQNGPT